MRRFPGTYLSLVILLGGLLWNPQNSWSHEGAEHSHEIPAPSIAPVEQSREITTPQFELVIKPATWAAGKSQKIRLLLADYNSNAPIPNARIQIEWQRQNTTRLSQVSAGIYETDINLPAGQYNPVVNITTPHQTADLLWDGLTLQPAVPIENPTGSRTGWMIWISVTLFGLLGLWGWKKRRQVYKPLL